MAPLQYLINTLKSGNTNCVAMFGVSRFEYILSLIMTEWTSFKRYNLRSDLIQSPYGMPSVIYELHGNQTETDMLNIRPRIEEMIKSFPLYGTSFLTYIGNESHMGNKWINLNTFYVEAFEYGPDYDICTMTFKDYSKLIFSEMWDEFPSREWMCHTLTDTPWHLCYRRYRLMDNPLTERDVRLGLDCGALAGYMHVFMLHTAIATDLSIYDNIQELRCEENSKTIIGFGCDSRTEIPIRAIKKG